VTKTVTDTDALVLSCVTAPEGPLAWSKVWDSFERFLATLQSGSVKLGVDDPDSTVADAVFRWTALLKDGTVGPQPLPAAWRGRVNPQIANAYVRNDWSLALRPTGWGVPARFSSIQDAEDGGLNLKAKVPLIRPLVDPVLDAGVPDGEELLPVEPLPEAPWDEFFTPWERVDGFLAYQGRAEPGPAWLGRRVRKIGCPGSKVWCQLRGLRDGGEADLYGGMWNEPALITVFCGWPAYFLHALRDTSSCSFCGSPIARGTLYCASPECNRERGAQRKRDSRAARSAMARVKT
jgi:hypothetical protein